MTEVVSYLGLASFGWLLGIPLALIAAWLSGDLKRLPEWVDARLLRLDPLLQAFQALVLCGLGWRFGWSAQLAAYGALSMVLTLVLFIDLRTRFVYSVVALPGIVAGVVLTPLIAGAPWWGGLVSALLGAVVLGALYLLGRVLYRGGEPLATGDITIGALVGSVVGLGHLGPAIFYGVILSGLLALVYATRARSLNSFLPYGPGLCLGALLALLS